MLCYDSVVRKQTAFTEVEQLLVYEDSSSYEKIPSVTLVLLLYLRHILHWEQLMQYILSTTYFVKDAFTAIADFTIKLQNASRRNLIFRQIACHFSIFNIRFNTLVLYWPFSLAK